MKSHAIDKDHEEKEWTSFHFRGREIFLTSAKYAKNVNGIDAFYEEHKIKNVVNFRDIREEMADPEKIKAVLNKFIQALDKGITREGNILMHCERGLNRTPVGALIYLIREGEDYETAKKIIEDALILRDSSKPIKINAGGMYTSVLQSARNRFCKGTTGPVNDHSVVCSSSSTSGSNRAENNSLPVTNSVLPRKRIRSTELSDIQRREVRWGLGWFEEDVARRQQEKEEKAGKRNSQTNLHLGKK